MSLNLRRELSDKTGREEMYSLVRTETDNVEKKLLVCVSENCKQTAVPSMNLSFYYCRH
jgi:hypothetical protein